jgi:hypothetical protein
MAAPDDAGPPYSPPWPPGRRAVAAMVWSGFLAACLGSLLGFAWLDPGALLAVGGAPDWLTPDAVYTLGFFLFFTVGLAGACLGVYLTRPPE